MSSLRQLVRPFPVALGALLHAACTESTRPDDAPGIGAPDEATASAGRTTLTLDGPRLRLNGALTYQDTPAEGLLLNVRMVNSVFTDEERPRFDPERNTAEFVARMPEYVEHGVLGFTVGLQGGYPGYEGARNSAFYADGSLDDAYLARVARVIERADALGAVVILSLFYQRQDEALRDADALEKAVVNVVDWIKRKGYRNLILEIANEYGHAGYDHAALRSDAGVAGLIRLAQGRHASLPVSASTRGDARITPRVADAADVILVHFNQLSTSQMGARVRAIRDDYPRKPVICNEDDRTGAAAVDALMASVDAGASYGLMVERINQHYPFEFRGTADDPRTYDRYRDLTR